MQCHLPVYKDTNNVYVEKITSKRKEMYIKISIKTRPVILLHEKSGRTFCPKTRKTFRTFLENLGQNSCQSNFHSTGC